jgi:5'-nucleotidase
MEILLTNDDSHSSPLFEIAIEKLKTMGNLQIVVPKEEQSWTGKSISRFRHLYVDEIKLNGEMAKCLDGTPADCINWGIYHLYDQKPDLVVSGINIGINSGLGFVLSSGTVGACLEANIAGVPGVALSQDFTRDIFMQWIHERVMHEDVLTHLRTQSMILLENVFDELLNSEKILNRPMTWNVNLPYQAAPQCRMLRTFLGHSFYSSCFKRKGDRYHHEMDPPQVDQRELADSTVVRTGHISLTTIDIRDMGRLTKE